MESQANPNSANALNSRDISKHPGTYLWKKPSFRCRRENRRTRRKPTEASLDWKPNAHKCRNPGTNPGLIGAKWRKIILPQTNKASSNRHGCPYKYICPCMVHPQKLSESDGEFQSVVGMTKWSAIYVLFLPFAESKRYWEAVCLRITIILKNY